jgi:hypothetical protein
MTTAVAAENCWTFSWLASDEVSLADCILVLSVSLVPQALNKNSKIADINFISISSLLSGDDSM